MEYPSPLLSLAGNTLAAAGTSLSVGAWVAGGLIGAADPTVLERAGSAGIGGLILGLTTLAVNGLIADRRDKRRIEERKIEADQRFNDLQIRTIELLAKADREKSDAVAAEARKAELVIEGLQNELVGLRAFTLTLTRSEQIAKEVKSAGGVEPRGYLKSLGPPS